jgi:hypothetical protein
MLSAIPSAIICRIIPNEPRALAANVSFFSFLAWVDVRSISLFYVIVEEEGDGGV